MRNEYDQFLELGTKLYITGIQVEVARDKIESLVEMGHALSSDAVLEANQEFSRLSNLFTDLEGEYLALRDSIRGISGEKVYVGGGSAPKKGKPSQVLGLLDRRVLRELDVGRDAHGARLQHDTAK